jgi:hypothetical protein
MRVSLKSVLAGVALSAVASAASAATVAVSSTVPQSGFIGLQTGGTYPITGVPYDFTGQTNGLGNVSSIDSLTVTLTANDGDTGPGDFDFGSLTLALDGINTGLALNGLLNGQISTVTLNTLAPGLQAALITALQDGLLIGTALDADADGPAGDIIGFPAAVDTTLDLVLSGPNLAGPGNGGPGGPGNNVPLPAAVLIAPLGAGLAGMYSRRFRRAK